MKENSTVSKNNISWSNIQRSEGLLEHLHSTSVHVSSVNSGVCAYSSGPGRGCQDSPWWEVSQQQQVSPLSPLLRFHMAPLQTTEMGATFKDFSAGGGVGVKVEENKTWQSLTGDHRNCSVSSRGIWQNRQFGFNMCLRYLLPKHQQKHLFSNSQHKISGFV